MGEVLGFPPGSHRHNTPVPTPCLFRTARPLRRRVDAAGPVEHRQAATGLADGAPVVVGEDDPPHLDRAADAHRRGLGGEVAVAQPPQVTGAELDPDHAALGPGGQGGTEAGGRLGEERGNAAMEDSERLVHPPVDREPHHHPFGPGLEDLDVEEVVDAPLAAGLGEGPGARRSRRGGHHGSVTGRR